VRTLADATEVLAFSNSGLSKIVGLPQMKLGWIVIAGPSTARAEAKDKLEWIADTYLSVSTPVQQAAPRLLGLGKGIQAQIAARVRANLAWLEAAIAADSPCRILAVEGAAGTPRCRCRASAAKENGRSNCWRRTTSWCSPASSMISNPKRSWCSAC